MRHRLLVTEEMIREAVSQGKKRVEIPHHAIVTPAASQYAFERGAKIVRVSEANPMNSPSETAGQQPTVQHQPSKLIAFGSDHGGFKLKEELKAFAQKLGYAALDVGTYDENPCDYPDFAYAVAKAVSSGEAWRGVMIDGAGIGSCVVANKVPGVKAACCHNEFVARNAREHNDTNVLTLGSRVTGSEVCKEIMKIWLETWFAGGRHKQRVDKIDQIEKRFLK